MFGGTGAGWVETEMTLYAVTMLIMNRDVVLVAAYKGLRAQERSGIGGQK